ncbi:MAG: DeoR/GlpR family DNA-binding transcription regulator [Eubacteriales bacterium]
MFAVERKNLIKRFLAENKKVSVAKLSELLEVSEVTIRRDLEVLEKTGFLQRTHGGAVLVEESLHNSIPENNNIVDQRYTEIANTAFSLVSDNDTILLTSGKVNVQIAKRLTQKSNLTVVTNDLYIAMEFSSSPLNKLIMLGGDLSGNAVYGQLTLNNLNDFALKHVFAEVSGISKDNGISVNSISKASLIQQACKNTKIITVVCTAENFDKDSLYRVGPITMPRRIITNPNLSDDYKKFIYESNIQLYTSVDLYEG